MVWRARDKYAVLKNWKNRFKSFAAGGRTSVWRALPAVSIPKVCFFAKGVSIAMRDIMLGHNHVSI